MANIIVGKNIEYGEKIILNDSDKKSILLLGNSKKDINSLMHKFVLQSFKFNEHVVVVDTLGYLIEKLEDNKNLEIFSPENGQEIDTEKIDKIFDSNSFDPLIVDLPCGLLGEINCKRLGKNIFDYIYSKLKSQLEVEESMRFKISFYIFGLNDFVSESILKMLSEKSQLNADFVICLTSLNLLTEYPQKIVWENLENKILLKSSKEDIEQLITSFKNINSEDIFKLQSNEAYFFPDSEYNEGIKINF